MKIISITGTKGKTTLVFLLDAVLRNSGKKVLCINSEGIFSNGRLIKDNEYFLKKYQTSANVVAVREIDKEKAKKYDYILLESSFSNARNLEQSFAGKNIDLGVLTNVYRDHIDGKKIKNRSCLLQRKVDVLKNIKKGGTALVFTGDLKNNISQRALDIFKKERPDIETKAYSNNKRARSIVPDYYLHGDFIWKNKEKLLSYDKLNLPFKRMHAPTDASMVALTAVLNELGVDTDIIFSSKSLENIVPGRMNVFAKDGKTVILDYAHEIQSLRSAAKLLRKKFKNKTIIAVVRLSYYRSEKNIITLTEQMAGLFDRFIVYDKAVSRENLRKVFTYDKESGYVARIMHKTLLKKNAFAKIVNDEFEAIEKGISEIGENAVLYVIGDQITKDVACIKRSLSGK